jgi:hypothetical protein
MYYEISHEEHEGLKGKEHGAWKNGTWHTFYPFFIGSSRRGAFE